jgi:cyclic pyranopterin phosphate synthase
MNQSRLSSKQEEILRVKELFKNAGQDPEKFCVVPFLGLILEPDGSVGVCRQKGTKYTFGNLKTQTLEEIWNGEGIRNWRREFLEQKPKICSADMKHCHCHLCPENSKLLDQIELAEIQTRPMLKLTANFNGKCNLQCQMCDIWKQPNGLYDELNFWEYAKQQVFPHLKEIDMLSGEPFIQKDTYRLIDEVSTLNPSCQWMFTTNMHWKLTEQIKGFLNKIQIKYVIASIDSLNVQTYHKIRFPGDLNFVLENLDRFIDYRDSRGINGHSPFRIDMNFLIQQDNWREASEAILFCESKKINPFVTFLYEPHQFSLNALPENERIKILDYYFENFDRETLIKLMRVITPLMDNLSPINKAERLMALAPILRP